MSLTDWQPIATAPKDGTEILIYGPFCDVCVGLWEYGGWKEASRGSGYEYDPSLWDYPTHWMPLPAAPTKSEP